MHAHQPGSVARHERATTLYICIRRINPRGGLCELVQTNAPDRRRWVESPISAFAISAIQQAEGNNEAWVRSFHNLIMSCDVGGHNGTRIW